MTHPSDKLLFAQIERATAGARTLLCTLGRLGKAFRLDESARAGMILLASEAHPVYKGGRLLFDLLELEDLMLDGPQPEALDQQSVTAALRSTIGAFAGLVRVLHEFAGDISRESRTHDAVPGTNLPPRAAEQEDASMRVLPELDASEYLYDLVVLGILSELSRMAAAEEAQPNVHQETGTPEPPDENGLPASDRE